jgi:nucleotide-binding universal stress UspA family protein
MRSIVIATDGSAGATHAIREGLELARAAEAEVTFLSVVGVPAVPERQARYAARARGRLLGNA